MTIHNTSGTKTLADIGDYRPRSREVDWHELRKPFDQREISRLPKTAKRPALDYVGHAAVTNRLNRYAAGWTYRIEPVVVRGSIVVHDRQAQFVPDENGLPHVLAVFGEMTIGGVSRQEVGEVDAFSTYGLEMKNAISDFIRRAAMRFGVGLDLWSKEDLSPGESRATATVQGQQSPSQPDGRPQVGSGTTTTPISPGTSGSAVEELPLVAADPGSEPGGPADPVRSGEKAGSPGSYPSEAGEPVRTGEAGAPASLEEDLAGLTLSELTDLGTRLANNSRSEFRQWVNKVNGTHYKVVDFEQLVTHEELEAGVRRLQDFRTGKT